MADSISAFFQSLFPDSRPKGAPAPTRLRTETRTVGSESSATTSSSLQAEKKTADGVTSDGVTSDGVTSENMKATERTCAGSSNPEQLRNLRGRFLDERFGASGKKKGTHTKATSKQPIKQQVTNEL
jgi:hypothetical protein